MYSTYISHVIDAPLDTVWATMRPFDSLEVWHPAVKRCTFEPGGADAQLGCIRSIELADGSGVVRETLLALSDTENTIVYDIIDSPMPVSDYVATIKLFPVSEGNKTFAHWSVEFNTDEGNREQMIQQLQGIFRDGLFGVASQLE